MNVTVDADALRLVLDHYEAGDRKIDAESDQAIAKLREALHDPQ